VKTGLSIVLLALWTSHASALEWPDAAERTERASVSNDPAARLMAARAGARLGRERAAPMLVRLLADADPDVRIAAARSATTLKLKDTLEGLPSWINERSTDLRLAACESMKALPDARWVPPLARALADSDPKVRTLAAEALGHQATPEAVVPLLGKLDDPTPAVREAVIAALMRLRDSRAVIPLVGKTQDSTAEVRQIAARALGVMADARATMALVQLTRDANNEVRATAARALRSVRAIESVDALALAAKDREPQVRLAAIESLGAIPSDEAVQTLVLLLGGQDDRSGSASETPVRKALVEQGGRAIAPLFRLVQTGGSGAESASWVLGELTIADAVLIEALRAGRLSPAAVLPALKAETSLPVTLEYISSKTVAVRRAARNAALRVLSGRTPDGRVVGPVAAVFDSSSREEQAELLALLGRARAPEGAAFAQKALRNRETELAAVDALGNLPSEQGSAALVSLLSASDAELRTHASASLFQSGTEPAAKLLAAALRDGSRSIDRKAAMIALLGALTRSGARVDTNFATSPAERDFILQGLVAGQAELAEPSAPQGRVLMARGLAAHLVWQRRVAVTKARLIRLLADPNDDVKNEAAWSLGALPSTDSTVTKLLTDAGTGNAAIAVNASGALARLGATAQLCGFLRHTDPRVQSNALKGLARAASRCGGGDAERNLLSSSSKQVRAAAALALWRKQLHEDDARALARCSVEDADAEVQVTCKRAPAESTQSAEADLTLLLVVSESTPSVYAPFVLQYSNGLIRTGSTDGLGAILDFSTGTVRMLAQDHRTP
jgi:HEAT repeat protein